MIEKVDPSFFYQKETMGTTIMAIKYEGGVIACADSSNPAILFRDLIWWSLYRRQSC